MRVLICGDRHWCDNDTIKKYLESLPKDTVIIEGEAPGADIMAREEAQKLGLKVLWFPAEWAKYGRSAGPIRNKRMLDEDKPDLVVAFHNNIEKSKGTRNMLKQAEMAKIPIKLFRSGETDNLVADHYGSQPKPKRLYRLLEDQLTILHDWDEDQAKVITLWREAHRAKPSKYHEIFLTEKDGEVHGLCQLKPGECSRGIPEHDLSCEECDNYKTIEGKRRCQELHITGWER